MGEEIEYDLTIKLCLNVDIDKIVMEIEAGNVYLSDILNTLIWNDDVKTVLQLDEIYPGFVFNDEHRKFNIINRLCRNGDIEQIRKLETQDIFTGKCLFNLLCFSLDIARYTIEEKGINIYTNAHNSNLCYDQEWRLIDNLLYDVHFADDNREELKNFYISLGGDIELVEEHI